MAKVQKKKSPKNYPLLVVINGAACVFGVYIALTMWSDMILYNLLLLFTLLLINAVWIALYMRSLHFNKKRKLKLASMFASESSLATYLGVIVGAIMLSFAIQQNSQCVSDCGILEYPNLILFFLAWAVFTSTALVLPLSVFWEPLVKVLRTKIEI